MGFSDAEILQWFTQYVYQPWLVYLGIFVLMMASGFGLPIPEEVTLVSSGLVCFAATRPNLPPPPYPNAHLVDPYITAGVAFFSVIFADCLVYFLGKFFGGKVQRSQFIDRYRSRFDQVSDWTKRYGMWAAGAFRFTPGLRFPGHFACGMMGLSISKFIAVDAMAAAVSVPTQVLLVAFYGETILYYFKQFKMGILAVVIALVLFYLGRWLWRRIPHES